MYCVYNDSHWSLVSIFLGSGSWIVLRVGPSSPELDKDTRTILEHLKWTQTMEPNYREASRGQEDILIDITVPVERDTQTCGLRVLQYHAIIGNAFATRPEILREGEAILQHFIKETVFPQIQQVNAETTETYYNEMRLHLQQTEWGALLRMHPTWPDIQSMPRKREPPVQSRTANNHTGNEQIYRNELRQMQLWESRPRLLDTTNSSLELARDMEVQEPTQESTAQLRQIQRWLDESTLEEIQEFLQTQR